MSTKNKIKDGYVITYDGTVAKRADCKFIKGDFYIRDNQCFEIDGRWYRVNSGYIAYNHETCRYVLKNAELINGIVGIDDSGDFETGFFSENLSKNVKVVTPSSEIIALSEDIIKNKGYEEYQSPNEDVFVLSSHKPKISREQINPYKNIRKLPYNCYEVLQDATDNFKRFYVPLKKEDNYSKSITARETSLFRGTYGIELETHTGRVPPRFLYRLGLIPLRDGSIRGDEYVTIPFSNDIMQFRALEDICDVLRQYTTMTTENSLHVHMNVGEFEPLFFIAAFLVNSMVESEIFSIFPAFYSSTSKFKSSGKDYNNPLPTVNLSSLSTSDAFDVLYRVYSGGVSFKSLGSTTKASHPKDIASDRKWNVDIR